LVTYNPVNNSKSLSVLESMYYTEIG